MGLLPDGFEVEDIREALAAADRWGGVDDHIDGEGIAWRAPNAIKAMGHALAAALRSRARREQKISELGLADVRARVREYTGGHN